MQCNTSLKIKGTDGTAGIFHLQVSKHKYASPNYFFSPSIFCYKDFLKKRNSKAVVIVTIHFTGSMTNERHKLPVLALHLLFFSTLRREEACGAAAVGFLLGAGDPVEIPELTQSCRMLLWTADLSGLAPALWLWLFSPLSSMVHIIFPHNYFRNFCQRAHVLEDKQGLCSFNI